MSETVSMKFKRCYDYGELTGRKPKIEDFIGENAIFKGEWDIVKNGYDYTVLENESCLIWFWNSGKIEVFGKTIERIEDLPIEIEFKDEICG
jgi:hypothetical protein